MGIPTEVRSLIFEPFTQADGVVARKCGGSGLGLSIVRRLAKTMGGDAGFESTVGKGSRFWFRIQANLVTENAANAEDAKDAKDAKDGGNAENGLRYCILVADDNKTNATVIEAFLRKWEVKLLFAENGQEAFEVITRGEAVDLILMDVRMPVLDGYAATRLLRQWEADHNKKRLPVIALTSDAFEKTRQRCLASGMDDVITKPFSIEILQGVIRKWLPGKVRMMPLPTRKAVDEAFLKKEMTALLPMIEEQEFDAIARITALQELLVGNDLAEPIAEVRKLLRACNFDAALQRLHQLLASKGWEGETK